MRIKRVASFTLTEMLVVLAISVIVAGLAFTVLQMVGKNLNNIQNNYSRSTQTRLIEQQLIVDFNTFHYLSYNDEKDELVLKNPLDSITYTFEDEVLYRNTDTLIDEGYAKELFMTGNPIQSGSVDALKITFLNRTTDTFIFTFKENDATLYLVEHGN